MKKLLFILLTFTFSSICFSQDLKPFDKTEFDIERINSLYDKFSELAEREDTQEIKNIFNYVNKNFSWINDEKVKKRRQKEFIVKQMYSMFALVYLQEIKAESKEEAEFITIQFSKGGKSEKPIWDELHKKVWLFLM
jgi:hypothetical protein